MSKTITLDYDDIVGGMMLHNLKAYRLAKPYGIVKNTLREEVQEHIDILFDYIEKYQQSGLTLDEIERSASD